MKWLPILAMTLPLLSHSSVQAKVHGCNIQDDQQLWSFYKTQFVLPEGRVVDNGNDSISHSESQGYGMLMAAYFSDHATFKSLWHWTKQTLQRREDGLFSWKWQPQPPHIPDPNNASDGDIFIAWALLKADKLWPEQQYGKEAKKIIDALSDSHIIQLDGEYALLPAQYGFDKSYSTVINPSYWVYPAFNDFARFDDSWKQLSQGGINILNKNQFGSFKLPSDWLEYRNDTWQPAQQFPAQFSYASYRIPLYLIWGGYNSVINDHYQSWISEYNRAWVNISNNQMANYAAPRGANAVATLVQLSQEKYKHRSALPHPTKADDYYSASLIIFSHIAFHERYCQ
ncbi:endoglucanase [Photobacterium sanctipauli]|uniref:Glucanase n=1 Tax=Photobacterium sanctipauli TaxID=1342794 RepID=A0A2T3P0E2_9GAMM|nr:glycosyl hydrolase family 8 [Photobacterium sanctipauli]PSW21938.1 endoglucanase [Photobacterium sanctipauli]